MGHTEYIRLMITNIERIDHVSHQMADEPAIWRIHGDATILRIGHDYVVVAVDANTLRPQHSPIFRSSSGKPVQESTRRIEHFQAMVCRVCHDNSVHAIDRQEVSHAELLFPIPERSKLYHLLTGSGVDPDPAVLPIADHQVPVPQHPDPADPPEASGLPVNHFRAVIVQHHHSFRLPVTDHNLPRARVPEGRERFQPLDNHVRLPVAIQIFH